MSVYFCNSLRNGEYSNVLILVDSSNSSFSVKAFDLLSELRRFKYVTALVLEFKKMQSEEKTMHNTFYSNSKAKAIINGSDIGYLFKSIYITITSNIQKSIGKSSSFNISKHNPLAGSGSIKLPKELNHLKKV